MNLKAVPIKRDPDGHWQHPDLSDWPEGTPSSEMEYWVKKQGFKSESLRIGQHIDPTVIDRWLAGDSGYPDDFPVKNNTKDLIILAVTQSEEEIIIWLAKPVHSVSKGGYSDEIHTAA